MILRVSIIVFLFVFFTSCKNHYIKQKEEFAHLALKDNSENKTSLDSISRFKKKVDAETGRIISISEGELTKDGAETTLGNFVCDALLYAAANKFKEEKTDLVILNRGGLRTNLPKGEIKVINIFELMPFENEMVSVKITGEKLLEFLPLLLEKKHPFFGFKIKIEGTKITSALINNLEIEKTKIYTLITSDYLANGGDNFFFLKDPLGVKNYNIKIREAIIAYCDYLAINNKQIIPYKDGRLEVSK